MSDRLSIADEQIRELAREVLARPEYASFRAPKNVLQEWVEALAAWLEDLHAGVLSDALAWLRDAFGAVFGGLFGDSPLALLVRLVLAAGILLVFGVVVVTVVRALREGPRAGNGSSGGARVGVERSLIREADVHAGAGRFLEAAHCVQLAALELLLQREWLELQRSDPNRTLRQRLRGARLPEALRGRFVTLLDELESRWFRDRTGDRDLYRDWRELHRQLVALPR